MLVKFDVAIEFGRMLATSARIFFSSFRCYASLLFLLCQLLCFLLEFALDLRLVLSH